MADNENTVLRITGIQNASARAKYTGAINVKQSYPTGVILYTTKAELPVSLSRNALIFTTDTAELFVGTGNGIQRIKLGTEEDLNPRIYQKISDTVRDYLSKADAAAQKQDLENQIGALADKVYTKNEIDEFFIKDIDLDGIVDKLNVYTLERLDALLAEKAANVDVYTQDQVDAKFTATGNKISEVVTGYVNADTENLQAAKTYTDEKIAALPNTYYTKDEVKTLVEETIAGVLSSLINQMGD